ncbi:MAG: NFACT family protein [Nanoarchaeota archaeon]
MKLGTSSLELGYLIREFNILIGGKIDKIYEINNEIIIVIHLPNIGKKCLRIIPGKFIFFSDERDSAEEPSNLCRILRKHLENTRLRNITQKTSERIVEFLFEKETKKILYAELFSQGNIILCDENNGIITAKLLKVWKDRAILHNKSYDYPKLKLNFYNLSYDELRNIFSNTEKSSLVTCLAIDLGLGGTYSEEICLRAGIDKVIIPRDVTQSDIKKLLSGINMLLNEKLSPEIIYYKDAPIDVVPFSLQIYNGYEKKLFENYNSAVKFFYLNYYKPKTQKTPELRERERLNALILRQEEKISEIESKADEERRKADIIYNNYKLLSEMLRELKNVSERYSWQEIKEKLKSHKLIKEVKPEEKSVVVELNDIEVDDS